MLACHGSYRYFQATSNLYSLNYILCIYNYIIHIYIYTYIYREREREIAPVVLFSILLQFAPVLKHVCYNLPRRLV